MFITNKRLNTEQRDQRLFGKNKEERGRFTTGQIHLIIIKRREAAELLSLSNPEDAKHAGMALVNQRGGVLNSWVEGGDDN